MPDIMATRPPEPTPQLHHGRMRWTSRWTGRDGKQTSKRFGDVETVGRRVAMLEYSEWLKQWERRDSLEAINGRRYTVREMCTACREWARVKFGRSGKMTSSFLNYDISLRHFEDVYGDDVADEVRAPQIAKLRDDVFAYQWKEDGSRRLDKDAKPIVQTARTVNYRLLVVKQAYELAREAGKISAETMLDVIGVKRANPSDGKTRASRKIGPVPDATVLLTIGKCSQSLADMIRVQRLIGARPGEMCSMRPCDIELSTPDVWFYRPAEHKTSYADRDRLIVLPPAATKILESYINRPTHSRCFTPKEHCEQSRMPGRGGDHWTPDTYRDAVWRACRRAGVDEWSPNQLRHRWATEVRRQLGIEAVKEGLSHESEATSEIYAELSRDRLIEMARKLG